MNSKLSLAVIAVLAATLAFAPVGSAEAANKATVEDGRKQLSPKTFGDKTKTKIQNGDSDKTQKGNLDSVKKEQLKTYKKVVQQYKALDFAKQYYKKLG